MATSVLDSVNDGMDEIKYYIHDALESVERATKKKAKKMKREMKYMFHKRPQFYDKAKEFKGHLFHKNGTQKEEDGFIAFFARIFEKCCAPFDKNENMRRALFGY